MWGRDPRLTVFRDSAKFERLHGWPGPCNRAAGEVFAKHIVVDMFAKSVNGSETPQDAVAWAEQELKHVYETA